MTIDGRSHRRILGIDPGLRVTGFGVLEACDNELVYIASGCIRASGLAGLPVTCLRRSPLTAASLAREQGALR